MSVWHDRPENDGSIPNYRIMRTPAGRSLGGICLSSDIVGTLLHYWKGRSRPCHQGDCEACIAGHIPRWKGYVLLYSSKTQAIQIMEFTERVWPEIEQFRKQKGTLRGAIMTFERMNRKQNGPLQVRFEEHLFDQTSLPPEHNLREILARIWEVGQQMLPGMLESEEDIRQAKELKLA